MNEDRYRQAEQALWKAQPLEPSERRVSLASGPTVRVQEVGDGPPVLFVHGSPNSGSTWVPMLGPVAPAYRCILVDRPGTGLSEPYAAGTLTSESLPGLADRFLSDVLDALDISRAHIVASSFGGYLSLRSAAAHPDDPDGRGRCVALVELDRQRPLRLLVQELDHRTLPPSRFFRSHQKKSLRKRDTEFAA